MLVRDRMSRETVVVTAPELAERADELMRRHGVRHLPVVNGSRLIGILSDRDLGGVGPAAKVTEVMTPKPRSISPDASLDEAAQVMRSKRISALPVVEKSKLVGMLTAADVLSAFVDLSGVAEPTTRITVANRGQRAVGQRIRRIVHRCHGELKWVHREGCHTHLRVKSRQAGDIVTALEAEGFEVTAVLASPKTPKRVASK